MFFKKKKRNLVDDLELASKWVAKALNSSTISSRLQCRKFKRNRSFL